LKGRHAKERLVIIDDLHVNIVFALQPLNRLREELDSNPVSGRRFYIDQVYLCVTLLKDQPQDGRHMRRLISYGQCRETRYSPRIPGRRCMACLEGHRGGFRGFEHFNTPIRWRDGHVQSDRVVSLSTDLGERRESSVSQNAADHERGYCCANTNISRFPNAIYASFYPIHTQTLFGPGPFPGSSSRCGFKNPSSICLNALAGS